MRNRNRFVSLESLNGILLIRIGSINENTGMKTIRNNIFICIFLFIKLHVNGQESAFYSNVQKDVELATELFGNGNYISAFREFQKIQQRVEPQSELYAEAEYYKAVAALKAGYSAGNKMLTDFTKDFPESPHINTAYFYLGEYQFNKKQYTVAIRTFGNVNRKELGENEKILIAYQNGYANMMIEDYSIAEKEFNTVKDASSIYSKPAGYYWAHIMYQNEKYPEALDGFRKLNNDPAYSKVIPVYISHIYYKQEKYQEVVNYTVDILNDVEEEYKPELSKIIGDSYFHLKEYEKAIPYLAAYFEFSKLQTREENYALGYSYHAVGDCEKAMSYLEKATKGNDGIAQNAYFHLADCYIKLDQKEKAKMAYDAASNLDFDPKIKEESLFNYAKLTYELSYSPFNETIKAFDKYIEKYPNSENNAEAYRILSEVYMVTRNYKDAITSIEKIKTKTPAIQKAYQKVTFYRGLELFNNLSYNQAISYFDISLKNNIDKSVFAQALYWKAESFYRTADYQEAVNNYVRFLSSNGASVLPEYNNARYNLAYSYFKIEDYESSANQFNKYISSVNGTRNEKQADALNRLGDIAFLGSKYQEAQQNYQLAYNMKLFEPDYSLYQLAFCKGLQRDQQGKIENLEQLLSSYPESAYRDDAMYELGRAYERLGENQKAMNQYNNIVQNYGQSAYYRKAMLQMGLISYNNGDYEKSIAIYKEVAEKYPETPEAATALLGIKNSYIELNNVDGYVEYTRKAGTNINSSEQDSLTFNAAERVYMAGDKGAQAQLEKYLQQFPKGSFEVNARFYLGELYYKSGKFTEANSHYTYVVSQPDNNFTEPALSKSAELTLNAQKYTEALELCNRLEKTASSKWNEQRANIGQMRCNLALKEYENAITAAGKVLKSGIANDAMVREANYTIGKSAFIMNNLEKAIENLSKVSVDVKYEQGAESKYLLAEIYFKQKNLQKAEDEIMDFIEKNTPYQFWLGKSFLLLAEIYMNRGQEFEAKHTLKSLFENYNNESDGIKAEASKRLQVIEGKEQQEQQQAIDSSFQMKIKQ